MQQSRDTKPAQGGKTARVLAALVALTACVFLVAASASAAPPYQPVIHHVNVNATGANDGTSWATAFTDLQSALDAAVSGDAIWVAAGTYTPSRSIDSSDPRTAAFVLKSGVAIYGGFAGSETALGERSSDPVLTVLSGDIGTAGVHSDNSYHVVYAVGVTNAVLDGFTVTLGRADGSQFEDARGGGMYTKNSLLTVSNCVFSDNSALYAGGGLYNEDSALTVSDCLFNGNEVGVLFHYGGRGGGMYNLGGYADLESPLPSRSSVITGCRFRNNWSYSGYYGDGAGGGGMYAGESQPTIDRCTFERNRAWGPGAQGGGLFNWLGEPTITNSVFFGNAALQAGGGVANFGVATILNSTFYGNGWWPLPSGGMASATAEGGAIYQDRGGFRIVDVIFSGNAASRTGAGVWALAAGLPGSVTITRCLFHENRGNYGKDMDHHRLRESAEVSDSLLNVDPLLADPGNGDFHLLAGSPAIDAGVTQKYAEMTWLPLPETDFEGDKRVVDGDGFRGAAADIGADEHVPTLEELRNLIVDLHGTEQIDEGSASSLLGFVDDAQTALDDGYPDSARFILEDMIDWLKALEDTETTELILRKAEAVHGTFD